MSEVIDNLNNSVASLQATANAVIAKIDELKNTNNDPAIQAATDTINNVIIALTESLQ
jgi:hypothetical protein